MTDDFMDRTRANWRASDEAIERLAERMQRRRMWSLLAFAGELFAAVVAVAAGAWLMVWNIDGYVVLGRIAGAVLLIAVPILTVASWFVRRAQPQWEAETPEGVLRHALRRIDMTRSLMHLARWHAYVLAGFVAALWVAAAAGAVAADGMLAAFTVFYLAVAAGAFMWAEWRTARIARERERCEALLAEFQRDNS